MKIITLDGIKDGEIFAEYGEGGPLTKETELSTEALDAGEEFFSDQAGKGRKKKEKDSARTVALRIIGYKDNTESALRRKLKERGFEKEAVDDAVEYLKKYGYLDEVRMMIARVRSLANNKLYGKSRITAELRRLGFSTETLASLDYDSDELCDLDFEENCRTLLKKLGGGEDRKTVAHMLRYGYGMSDIKRALSSL